MATKVDELIKKGETSFRSGEFEDALDSFNRVTKLDPEESRAWVGKGKSIFKTARISLDYDHALEFLEKGLEIDPENAEAEKYIELVKKHQKLSRKKAVKQKGADSDVEAPTSSRKGLVLMLVSMIAFALGFLLYLSDSSNTAFFGSLFEDGTLEQAGTYLMYISVFLFMLGTVLEMPSRERDD